MTFFRRPDPLRRFPIVTVLLIAANVLAAFGLLFYDLADQFGFRADHPSLRTAFSSLFLHANVVHLLGNMIFLAAVGAAVELATGSLRFASVYLLGGVVGVACHWLIFHKSPGTPPLIGASGCIAGCTGYYSVRYTGLRVPVAPGISLSVASITIVWILLQAIGAVVHLGDPQAQVSFWAHLGGFLAGVGLSAVYRAPDLAQIKLGHDVLEKMNERGPAAMVASAKRHLAKHSGDAVALRQLARGYAHMDDKNAEAQTILKLMDKEPQEEQAALLGRLLEIQRASVYSSSKRTMLAEKFKEAHPALSRGLLMSILKDPDQDPYRPEALLALVALERDSEPESADRLLQELLSLYPLHPCAELARKRGWVT